VAIDILGGATRIEPLLGQGQPASGTGRWFPPFSRMMFMFWNDILLNPCWMMKRRWSVWLNFWWLSERLWNANRVLDDDKNVNVLKWPV
jgi:hypothetical protein